MLFLQTHNDISTSSEGGGGSVCREIVKNRFSRRIANVTVPNFADQYPRLIPSSTVLIANPSAWHYLVLVEGEGPTKVYGACLTCPLPLLPPAESASDVRSKAADFLSQFDSAEFGLMSRWPVLGSLNLEYSDGSQPDWMEAALEPDATSAPRPVIRLFSSRPLPPLTAPDPPPPEAERTPRHPDFPVSPASSVCFCLYATQPSSSLVSKFANSSIAVDLREFASSFRARFETSSFLYFPSAQFIDGSTNVVGFQPKGRLTDGDLLKLKERFLLAVDHSPYNDITMDDIDALETEALNLLYKEYFWVVRTTDFPDMEEFYYDDFPDPLPVLEENLTQFFGFESDTILRSLWEISKTPLRLPPKRVREGP